MTYTISILAALLILGVSAYYDSNTMKIPNQVTFPAILAGLVYSLIFFHTGSFFSRLAAIAVLFFFGMLDLMGMGDLKLCMAVTAWAGWKHTLFMVLFASLFMLLYCAMEDRAKTWKEIKATILKLVYRIPVNGRNGKCYPFSVFLLLGFLVARIAL